MYSSIHSLKHTFAVAWTTRSTLNQWPAQQLNASGNSFPLYLLSDCPMLEAVIFFAYPIYSWLAALTRITST